MSTAPVPDYSRAFVKVPRAVLRELLPDVVTLAVYLALLDRAAYQAGPRLLRGHGVVHLDVGQCVFGRAELATICGIGERPARTSLNALRKLGYVTTKATNLGTIATIRGYGEIADDDGAERPADRPANDQQNDQQTPSGSTTNGDKRRKKRKDEDKKSSIHRLRDFWVSRYKAKHGSDYVVVPADYRLLKQLEGSPGVEETERRMAIAFDAPPPWPAQPWSLGDFLRQINKCAEPTEARASTNDVRTGRVEPQTDPSAYGDGDQEL